MKKLTATLKDYPIEVRPREKLLNHGAESLSEQELLAILLGTGTREKSALDLASDILAEGGLIALTNLSVEELKEKKGVGLAKASQLKAAIELGRRLGRQKISSRPVIRTPQDAFILVKGEMAYLDREYFRAINLNTKNQVLAIDTVSVGCLNATLVHPREVFKAPIKRSAAKLILVHNHPSGDTQPSREDQELTKRLYQAGALLGIEIVDHLIIGQNNYLSMRENGYFLERLLT
ncbi:MAG: DNA repair protein RadC [Peptococcia bacterium]